MSVDSRSGHPEHGRGVFAALVALISLIWLVLIVAAPFIAPPLAALSYVVGSFICHQLPERSFHLGAFQLPVCARCAGIYAGFALSAASSCLGQTARLAQITVRLRPAALWIAMVTTLPTVLTLVLEWSGIWGGSNAGRALAGVVLGIGVGLVVMGALATLHYSGCVPRRPTVPSPPQPHI